MKMMRFFDYLYYALGPDFRFRFMPFIWLFLLIIIVLEPTGKVWYYVLPISAALIVFVIDYVFEKRATKARKYLIKTKYSKPGWKFLTRAVWIVLWTVVPAIIIFVTRKYIH